MWASPTVNSGQWLVNSIGRDTRARFYKCLIFITSGFVQNAYAFRGPHKERARLRDK